MQGIATSHAKYLGKEGIMSHSSKDGTTSGGRIRSVVSAGLTAENIYCGQKSNPAIDIVLALVIDDGVDGRGHRKNVFNPDIKHIACGTADHPYGMVVVFDYCGETSIKGKGMDSYKPSLMKIDHEEMKKMSEDFGDDDEEDMPAGCISKSTNVKTMTCGKEKTVTTVTTFKFKDG